MSTVAERLETARADLADATQILARIAGDIDAVQVRIARTREQLDAAGNVFERLRLTAQLNGQQAQLMLLRSRQRDTEARIALLERRVALLLEEEALAATLGELPDATLPVALLPVRIETRFASVGETHELLLRVYPDDIHLDSHEAELTASEETWGRHFWQQIWRTGRGTDETAESQRQQVWAQLAARFGPERAAWVAHVLRPLNPEARPGTPLAADAPLPESPDFASPQRREESWTRAPLARALPDRFIVTAYRNDERVLLHAGEPLPKRLAAGPDPSAEASEIPDATDQLVVDEGMRWLVDFAEAQRVGMGMRIPLMPDDARLGFDTLFVVGMRSAATAQADNTELENLLDAHHFTEGLAFVPPGTPTNNTTDVKSGFSSLDLGFVTSYAVERVQPDATDNSNGVVTARALGISPETLRHVLHADDEEETAARAMNTALWSATGGYFLEQLFADALPPELEQRARKHFVTQVRAGGFLPAVRVGNQPYGILPVTLPDGLRESGSAESGDNAIDLLKALRKRWAAAAQRTPRVHEEADQAQAEETLLKILSASPASLEYAGRPVFDHDFFGATGNPGGQSGVAQLQQRTSTVRALLRELGILRETRVLRTILSSETFSMDAQLVERENLPAAAGPAEMTAAEYIGWLLASSYETIRDETSLPAASTPPKSLLYLLLRHSLLLAHATVAFRIQLAAGEAVPEDRQDPALIDIRAPGTRTVGRHVEHGLPGIDAVPLHELTAAQHPAAALLDEVRASFKQLQRQPVATLERLLSETLDLFSHRLDAWLSSLATARLQDMRAARPSGIVLGSFCWVENLRPAAPAAQVTELPEDEVAPLVSAAGNAGFVHAPSLHHAATAAVMRSGYLASTGEAQSHPLAIDLTSERVRLAQWLLDGVREGQPLRALLGYRFERSLHDRQLDRYIMPFRRIAPFGELNKIAIALEAEDNEVTRLRNTPHPDLVGARVRAGNARTAIQRLENERGRMTTQRSTAQSDVQRFEAQLSTTRQQINQVQNVRARLERMRPPRPTDHLIAQLQQLETRKRNLENSISRARQRENTANTRLQQIPAELTTQRNRERDAERDIQRLEGAPHPDLAAAEARAQALRTQHQELLDAHRERFLYPDSAELEALESLAASNVVDGLALLDLFRDNSIPFGANNGLPDIGSDDHAALLIELAGLNDTVDAVSDLLTAESVHQMIGGNPLRSGESLDAVARGEAPPPEFDVVRTPRTGIAITHRLVVLLGPQAAPSSWPRAAQHVMAFAEPRLENWAGQLLGDPAKVRCRARYLDPQSTAVLLVRDVSLSELTQCALEVIYLAGDGEDALIRALDVELQAHLLHTRPATIPAEANVALDFDRQADWAPDDVGFVEFVGLASAVASSLLGARAVENDDLAQDTGNGTVNLGELRARTDGAVAALEAIHAELDVLQSDSAAVTANAWQSILQRVRHFGVAQAEPALATSESQHDVPTLIAQAAAVRQQLDKQLAQLSVMGARFERAGAADNEVKAHDTVRLQVVFGPKFRVLPILTPSNGEQLGQTFDNSLALQAGDPLACVTWFQRAAQVRDGAGRLKRAMLYAEALGGQSLLDFRVGQLPHNANDRWVALPLSDGEAMPAGRLSLVAHMPTPFSPTDSVAGLLIDEWTEVAPNARELTGVALHFDQPGTEPAQTVLLAVPPDERAKWDIDLLESIVRDTFETVRLRTVDAQMLAEETNLDQILPALYFGLNLQGDTVSTDFTRAAQDSN